MADRYRIDWPNLEALPRRKRQDGATRDDLAARKYNMGKAKHKGRCHITNQKRRQIAKEKAAVASKNAAGKITAYRRYKNEVRAYWLGLREDHPQRKG